MQFEKRNVREIGEEGRMQNAKDDSESYIP
jgi:hypothetical protein